MVVHISKALEEAMHGDEAVLKYLEMGRECFQQGDKTALLGVVFLCARYQAVIPEWAADALLRVESDLKSEMVNDPNAAFGWIAPRKGERKKESRQKKLTPLVLGKLQSHRLSDGGLNADIDFQEIADELQISRREVEDIYRQSGRFIKDLPRNPPVGHVYGFGHATLPEHRRHGRPILRDEST